MKYRASTLKKYQLLSDKINDEQWSTPRLKEFWKKNRKFENRFFSNFVQSSDWIQNRRLQNRIFENFEIDF